MAESAPLSVPVLVDLNVTSPISEVRVEQAIVAAAGYRGFRHGEIGVKITDDPQIHAVNRDHLGHDYATDVISFPYRADVDCVEGEVIVSVETAAREAKRVGWSVQNELLLYLVHGVLHIAGMDDQNPADRAAMRVAEAEVLKELGVETVERFGPDFQAPERDSRETV